MSRGVVRASEELIFDEVLCVAWFGRFPRCRKYWVPISVFLSAMCLPSTVTRSYLYGVLLVYTVCLSSIGLCLGVPVLPMCFGLIRNRAIPVVPICLDTSIADNSL